MLSHSDTKSRNNGLKSFQRYYFTCTSSEKFLWGRVFHKIDPSIKIFQQIFRKLSIIILSVPFISVIFHEHSINDMVSVFRVLMVMLIRVFCSHKIMLRVTTYSLQLPFIFHWVFLLVVLFWTIQHRGQFPIIVLYQVLIFYNSH